MLVFPNCKINLGLHVLNKRADGYHNIETVFYPVNWCDALEILENKQNNSPFLWSQSGISIAGPAEQNLIYKAWQMIQAQKNLPPIQVHLHKNIPMGAGLGGGSADAAFFINALNNMFALNYSTEQKMAMAAQLGSDCAFFINNQAVFAQEKGDQFSTINIDLSPYYILLVYPHVHSNTRQAYEGLQPKPAQVDLKQLLAKPVASWRHMLVNDFEASIFKKYPQIQALKEQLYTAGALYASMSGSGSAVFGIFDKAPVIDLPQAYSHCLQKPGVKIL